MGNKSIGINAQETTNMKFIFCIIQYQKAFEKKMKILPQLTKEQIESLFVTI